MGTGEGTQMDRRGFLKLAGLGASTLKIGRNGHRRCTAIAHLGKRDHFRIDGSRRATPLATNQCTHLAVDRVPTAPFKNVVDRLSHKHIAERRRGGRRAKILTHTLDLIEHISQAIAGIDRGEFAIFDPSETMSRHAFYWWDKE